MINPPSFAFSEVFQTFSLFGDNDPRRVNWHVDRYVRNFYFKQYYNVGAYPEALNRTFPIHVLRHEEPEGWPVREWMEEAWAEKDAQEKKFNEYFRIPSYDRFHATAYWAGFQHCENLSLTRYDWRRNHAPSMIKVGHHLAWHLNNELPKPAKLPLMFSVEPVMLWTGQFEPDYLTKSKCGRIFHGVSWEF